MTLQIVSAAGVVLHVWFDFTWSRSSANTANCMNFVKYLNKFVLNNEIMNRQIMTKKNQPNKKNQIMNRQPKSNNLKLVVRNVT